MTNYNPRGSDPLRSPVGPQPGFGGGGWIAALIILIIIIVVLAWGWGGWWGGGTHNVANTPAPQATTNGNKAPGVNGAHPGTTGVAPNNTPNNNAPGK